jgi:hypothetical protein
MAASIVPVTTSLISLLVKPSPSPSDRNTSKFWKLLTSAHAAAIRHNHVPSDPPSFSEIRIAGDHTIKVMNVLTPSPNKFNFNFCAKSNFCKFDKLSKKEYQNIEHQII